MSKCEYHAFGVLRKNLQRLPTVHTISQTGKDDNRKSQALLCTELQDLNPKPSFITTITPICT